MSALSPMTKEEFYQNATVSVVFELSDEVVNLTYLRKKMRQILEVLGLTSEDSTAVEIMIYELAANSVRHSQSNTFKVGIELLRNEAVLTVSDNGIGFDPNAILLPGTMRPGSPCPNKNEAETCERMGGFGLPLVQSLSDHVKITPNPTQGMTIQVTKNLQPKL